MKETPKEQWLLKDVKQGDRLLYYFESEDPCDFAYGIEAEVVVEKVDETAVYIERYGRLSAFRRDNGHNADGWWQGIVVPFGEKHVWPGWEFRKKGIR